VAENPVRLTSSRLALGPRRAGVSEARNQPKQDAFPVSRPRLAGVYRSDTLRAYGITEKEVKFLEAIEGIGRPSNACAHKHQTEGALPNILLELGKRPEVWSHSLSHISTAGAALRHVGA
jgi:hypothetical protein